MLKNKFRHGFVWVTLALFAFSFAGHWIFGWFAYVREEQQHGQMPHTSDYVIEMSRDTLENWQSEFLQLVWQVMGLAFLLHVGSSQSKECGERLEAKIDYLLDQLEGGPQMRTKLDKQYLRT